MVNVRRTKKLILSYDNLLLLFFAAVYILDARGLSIIPVSSRDTLSILEFVALGAVVFVASMLISKSGRMFLKEESYLSMYMVIVTISVAVISLYSIKKYDENIIDVYVCSVPFLLFFMTPLLVYLMRKDPKSMRKVLKMLVVIGVSTSVMILIQGLCFDFGIPYVLPGSFRIGYRNGRIRVGVTNIGRFGTIFMLYKFVVGGKKRLLYGLFAALGVFVLIYYGQTRMDMISLAACAVAMLFFAGSKKPIYRVLLIVAFIVFLFYDYADVILESFSEKGDKGASTIARLGAIDYFYSVFKEDPLMGMGFIRPRNAYLRRIWTGPRGVFYFSDLGALGHLMQYGIIGVALYILPLARMIYITIQLLRQRRSESVWAIGVIAYILVSQVSLNYTEYQRGPGSVAYWAVMESLYKGEEYGFSREITPKS
ncbi:MAG: O-antigen ligase family protein [Lachnospiraceae bacterium]|nr:O-antigen ligase family protein [Lachnospiraceae bacterium]